jgi:hypothetical protein
MSARGPLRDQHPACGIAQHAGGNQNQFCGL